MMHTPEQEKGKGFWIPEAEKEFTEKGVHYKRMYKCIRCGKTVKEKTNFCPHCGRRNIEGNAEGIVINREETARQIQTMMDIDGFRDGDAISRRAAVAIIRSQPPEGMAGIPISFIDQLIRENPGQESAMYSRLKRKYEGYRRAESIHGSL
jgi:RNA polymerase subunit RPABC4/transcription elongation factor Spt4